LVEEGDGVVEVQAPKQAAVRLQTRFVEAM